MYHRLYITNVSLFFTAHQTVVHHWPFTMHHYINIYMRRLHCVVHCPRYFLPLCLGGRYEIVRTVFLNEERIGVKLLQKYLIYFYETVN